MGIKLFLVCIKTIGIMTYLFNNIEIPDINEADSLCLGRDPNWHEYLDFDKDCNRKIEAIGGFDAIWLWFVILFFCIGIPVLCWFRHIVMKILCCEGEPKHAPGQIA